MADGLVGADGQLVPKPVNPVHRLEHEVARTHRPNMAGKHAQEHQGKNVCATRIHVQVSYRDQYVPII